MTMVKRKRRLKKKYRILFTLLLAALAVLLIVLIVVACRKGGERSASSSLPVSSSGAVSSGLEDISSDAGISSVQSGASSESVSSANGPVSSQSGNVATSSSRPPASSQRPAVSSQKPAVTSQSGGGTALTGIYKGITWRSPTAVPCTFRYGRNLMLVNNYYELPEDFQWNLVYFNSGKQVTAQELARWDDNGWNYTPVVDAEAYAPLKKMFADAKAAGVPLALVSSFRSIKLQDSLFNDYVVANMNKGMSREEAIKAANSLRTYAGTSEHNTGLCFDLAEEGSGWLRVEFENTPQGKWLRENAPKYGFILRYPKDKTKITGISYEPWHFRYVGVEHAQKITEQGMCLEEYIDSLGGA